MSARLSSRLSLYREGVEYIARNEGAQFAEELDALMVVGLLASVFGKTREQVAADVVRFRREETSAA